MSILGPDNLATSFIGESPGKEHSGHHAEANNAEHTTGPTYTQDIPYTAVDSFIRTSSETILSHKHFICTQLCE